MGYHGGFLTPWFQNGPTKAFCIDAVETGGSAMVKNVRANTPIKTGELWGSIRRKVTVVRMGPRGMTYESGAYTNVEYAPYIEYGTGIWGKFGRPYIIRPKNPNGWLRWREFPSGRYVFAKSVLHPGIHGEHMFQEGALMTEAEFDRLVAPALDKWAKEVELQNPWAKPGLWGAFV